MFGHQHTLTLPVTIGPLALRILLMVVVPAITGFAMMRFFLPEPRRGERAVLAVTAAIAVLVELMLAKSGLRVPDQVILLLLAGAAVPLRVAMARKERTPAVTARLDWAGRCVLVAAAVVAGMQFWQAWRTPASSESAALQITGVVVGVVGLAWYVMSRPLRHRVGRVAVHVVAAVLAIATFAGSAQALALSLPDAQPRSPVSQGMAVDRPHSGWRVVDRAPH